MPSLTQTALNSAWAKNRKAFISACLASGVGVEQHKFQYSRTKGK